MYNVPLMFSQEQLSATTARDALLVWQTPELTGINRIPPRATLWPYASTADAVADRAPQRKLLDGQWKFKLVPTVEATPRDFMAVSTSDADWATVQVPGLWTMQGFGKPIYTNWKTAFTPAKPPFVPKENETGLYRVQFEVPADWSGKRIVLGFGGVECGCYSVWIDGVAIGLGKDSRLPSEFDVTPYVKAGGKHTLAVQVIRWADTTYIEDQDHWRQAGISRSVYLYATPKTYIHDVFAKATWDVVRGVGKLGVEARVNELPEKGWTVSVRLLDGAGKELLAEPLKGEVPHGLEGHNRPREPIADVTGEVPGALPWSHETPTLYTLVVTLRDKAGNEIDATRTRIGFKTVEIKNRELLINGKMVYIKGVNRHDHHDRTGKVLSREDYLKEIAVLKAHNFNAVRCSHYSNDPLWLDLCDEYGLLVIDEADIETHHHYAMLPHDTRYAFAFLDRCMRMCVRDRNHASIYMWSLGNESGYGPNQDAAAGWLRHADPTRPLHCEGAICKANSDWDRGHAATDVINPMYPSIDSIVDWAKTTKDWRPFIMCEYSHAMGNSNGSLADYWAAIEAHHGLQGGYIWELFDHGLVQKGKSGQERWAYGGDFDEVQHDTNFCCDGLIWPDRTPHPAMQECKRLFQPIAIGADDAANLRFTVRSKYDFITSGHVKIMWTLTVDGKEVSKGELERLDLKPDERRTIALNAKLPPVARGQEVHVNFTLIDTRDVPLVGKDKVMGFVQHAVPVTASLPAVRINRLAAKLSLQDGADVIRVTGGESDVMLDRKTGRLASWRVCGVELLTAGPLGHLWRAPTDNDGIRAWDYKKGIADWRARKALPRWTDAGLDHVVHEVTSITAAARADGAVVITTALAHRGGDVAAAVKETQELVILADGVLAFSHVFDVPTELNDLPRLGVVAQLPTGFDAMEWLGHGPGESYIDRHIGTPVGRYSSAIRERYVPYIMPQEHGNIFGLRWIAVRRADGVGILASADGLIEGKATLVSDETLTKSWHTDEFTLGNTPWLHLDVRQRGLGTASCGPDTLERYKIHAGQYRLSYRLAALAKADDANAVHRALLG